MESLKFVKGFSRIRKVRAFFIQGRDLKRATDFERAKSGCEIVRPIEILKLAETKPANQKSRV